MQARMDSSLAKISTRALRRKPCALCGRRLGDTPPADIVILLPEVYHRACLYPPSPSPVVAKLALRGYPSFWFQHWSGLYYHCTRKSGRQRYNVWTDSPAHATVFYARDKEHLTSWRVLAREMNAHLVSSSVDLDDVNLDE